MVARRRACSSLAFRAPVHFLRLHTRAQHLVCNEDYFGDRECDCGCGAVDIDCGDDPTIRSCDYLCDEYGATLVNDTEDIEKCYDADGNRIYQLRVRQPVASHARE